MEESVSKRIAQIARNTVQEIDRIAQLVSANDSSCSPARNESSSSSTSHESSSTPQVQQVLVSSQLREYRQFVLLSRVCDSRDRNALTECQAQLVVADAAD